MHLLHAYIHTHAHHTNRYDHLTFHSPWRFRSYAKAVDPVTLRGAKCGAVHE